MITVKTLAEFNHYCKNKSIVLVGNSTSMQDYNNSSLIDGYDIVVRFGLALDPDSDMIAKVGSKIDVWVGGIYANVHYKRKFKTKSVRDIEPLNDTVLLFNRSRLGLEKELNKSYSDIGNISLTMFSDPQIQNFYKMHDVDQNTTRLSAGAWAILFFMKKLPAVTCVDIIGFDAFTSGNTSKSGFCASWHKDGLAKNGVHSTNVEKRITNNYLAERRLRRVGNGNK